MVFETNFNLFLLIGSNSSLSLSVSVSLSYTSGEWKNEINPSVVLSITGECDPFRMTMSRMTKFTIRKVFCECLCSLCKMVGRHIGNRFSSTVKYDSLYSNDLMTQYKIKIEISVFNKSLI